MPCVWFGTAMVYCEEIRNEYITVLVSHWRVHKQARVVHCIENVTNSALRVATNIVSSSGTERK